MKDSKPKVLCVESDTTGVYVRKMLLEEAGYEVLVATDRELAQNLMDTNEIRAVLVDLSTIRANRSMLTRLKQLKPKVRTIVLSPYEWVPSDLSNEVDAVHTQLAPPEQLLNTLKKFVD